MVEIKEQVRRFIASNFYVPEPNVLADDDSLLDQGIVDSTGVLEVIDFLERDFGVTVEDAEVVPENLDSINRIARFVDRKRGANVH